MFKKIIKYIKFINEQKSEKEKNFNANKYVKDNYSIFKEIHVNLENMKKSLGKSNDIVFREFNIGDEKQTKAFICFVEGMVNKKLINEYVVKALMIDINTIKCDENLVYSDIYAKIKNKVMSASEVSEVNKYEDVLVEVLAGNTVLFINGYDSVIVINAKGGQQRPIEEPDTEVNVRGPREGFTEILLTNTSLLRRKIKSSNLIFESIVLGRETHTKISIAYIDGIAEIETVEEVKRRLNRIETDAILESGYIEQYIEDHPLSLFSTIGNSEKPDKVAAKLLEGRVAILCDGTPFVLTVPYLFVEALQASEDYYSRFYLSSLIRVFRFIAFFITIIVPSLYVAIETYHQEMVPTTLVLTASASREGVPFPAFVETIIMITVFELLRESGVRLPRQVGQSISIVGALIIGESAVRAGFISAPMVIIGALTGITSYVVPPLLDVIIFFRFFLLVLSSAFGIYGIVLGLMIMIAHMCSLKSFGSPYMSPFSPVVWKDLKDTLIRVPLRIMKSRPSSITRRNIKRSK